MKLTLLLAFFVFSISLAIPNDLFSQNWTFIKERNGIKIYTRIEKNSDLKSFRGEAILHTTMEKLSMYIGNVKNVDWWDENLKEINVLSFETDKRIRYYLVYHVPWPLTDRDLCVEAKITVDPLTGEKVVFAKPLPNVIPEKPGRVRIKNYWQKWDLKPIGNNLIHVTLEGFVDPGGNIPAWLYNMVITETPLKIMNGIKSRVEKKP
ncbi:MAG: START domain-containing protein [Bacteroidota bacterium]|nr:START domain-containing protein [Bacteroidota bacterium]